MKDKPPVDNENQLGLPFFDPEKSRDEQARDIGKFVEDFKRGGECPRCGVTTVEWKKTIISTAVASLVKLVSLYEGTPIHFDNFTVLKKDRNFSQLVNWDLIVSCPNDDQNKRTAGKWSPTKRGIDFVNKKVFIPKYIVTFDNKLIRHEGPHIDIEEALNDRFDYGGLLAINNLG